MAERRRKPWEEENGESMFDWVEISRGAEPRKKEEDPEPEPPKDEDPQPKPEKPHAPGPAAEAPPQPAEPAAETTARVERALRQGELLEVEVLLREMAPAKRAEVLETLQRYPNGQWMVERGQRIFRALWYEQRHGDVLVRQRMALRRDRDPIAPESIQRVIKQIVAEPQPEPRITEHSELKAIRQGLSGRDQIEIVWPGSDAVVVIEPAGIHLVERPVVPSGDTASRIEPLKEVVVKDVELSPDQPVEVVRSHAEPVVERTAEEPVPERVQPLEVVIPTEVVESLIEDEQLSVPSSERTLPPADDLIAELEEFIAEILDEADEIPETSESRSENAPTSSEVDIERDRSEPRAESVTSAPEVSEVITREAEPSKLSTDAELGSALAALEQTAFETLPPLAGGSGEAPRTPAKRSERRLEPEDAKPIQPYELPSVERPGHRSSRSAERAIYEHERHYQHVEHPPDERMKRKARKLIRLLARRYHLKLTPELQAYLLEILLAPKIVNGRRLWGLSLHREELIRILQTLWLQFGDVYGHRPPN